MKKHLLCWCDFWVREQISIWICNYNQSVVISYYTERLFWLFNNWKNNVANKIFSLWYLLPGQTSELLRGKKYDCETVRIIGHDAVCFHENVPSERKRIFFKSQSNFLIYFLFYRERRFMKGAGIFVLLKIPSTGLCYTPMV